MGNRSKFKGIGMSGGKGPRHAADTPGNRAARRAYAAQVRHRERVQNGRPYRAWSWATNYV